MLLSKKILSAWLSGNQRMCFAAPEILWSRYCSTKPILLKETIKKVQPFGKILVDLPYDVEIKTTDPHKYSNVSTLIVNLLSSDIMPEDQMKNDLFTVNILTDVCEIRAVENDEIPQGIKCLVQAPPSYDVEVKTSGEGNVHVSGMVSDVIHVQTEYGNISGSKLQGKKITLSSSEGGSITLKNSVQGNIEINTAKNGTVDAEKCLGTKLDISTENGDVMLGSNYCEAATFTTVNGHLNLNNLHMDSTIDMNGIGSLNISCLDGSLQANIGEGDANIQLVRITGDSHIKTNGNISLKVPEDSDTQLILHGQKLDVDKNINGTYSEDKKEFIVKNNGNKFEVETEKSVQVTRASWMDCLNLQKRSA